MYKTVYSPDGEMFEVPQHIFDDVILNQGWTQTKPIKVEKKVEKAEKPSRREAPKASAKKVSDKETAE